MKKKRYEIGDIVFVSKYNYDGGAEGQNHLFVIISDDDQLVPIEYFGMIVSSHLEKEKYSTNVRINKNSTNGLHKDSIVKCDYIYNIPSKNIQMKIGRVDIDDYLKFMEIYNDVLDKISKELEKV